MNVQTLQTPETMMQHRQEPGNACLVAYPLVAYLADETGVIYGYEFH